MNIRIIVRIFQSTMLNEENQIVSIKVKREEDPKKLLLYKQEISKHLFIKIDKNRKELIDEILLL